MNMFQKYDFVTEHKKIIDENNYVWMLKLGKKISIKKLDEVLNSDGGIVLKFDEKHGGAFYYCHICDYVVGKPTAEMIYPTYYSEMIDDYKSKNYYFEDYSLEGTWFKMDSFVELKRSDVEKLHLVLNDKSVLKVLGETRTTVMYIFYKE